MPWVRPCLSPVGLRLMLGFVVASAVQLGVSLTDYWSEMPRWEQWLTWHHAWTFAVVVALTKIAHELGHAVVCEHLGSRCRMIGPMWLVFTPALYCDTSDSWMLASRWKRIAIGAAGMLTELLIACACVWVWTWTSPGLVHTMAAKVILICGLSTVLFNANPLLRYDGYYMLSDWLGAPNLAQRASARLRRTTSAFLLRSRNTSVIGDRVDQSWWLLVYAFLSFIYRWLLMITIVGMIAWLFRGHRLEVLGIALSIAAMGCVLAATIVQVIRQSREFSIGKQIALPRLLLLLGVVTALVVFSLIPHRGYLTVVGRWVPSSETRVYAETDGVLASWLMSVDQVVAQGQLIAVLENPEIDDQVIAASGSVREHESQLASLLRSRREVPEIEDQIAIAEAALAQSRDRLVNARKRQSHLRIVAPVSGVMQPPAIRSTRMASASGDQYLLDPDGNFDPVDQRAPIRLASWNGRLGDQENQGCFVSSGTELLAIMSSQPMRLEVTVNARDLVWIRLGETATVIDDRFAKFSMTGVIEDLSRQRYDAATSGLRRDDREGQQQIETPETRYVVRVRIDDDQWRQLPGDVLVGGSGRAKLAITTISLSQRVWHHLTSLWRSRT
ncbi:MAG: HlyD family efflux transporter periplasmic adaptor subunit [Planctomycetota bacterium]